MPKTTANRKSRFPLANPTPNVIRFDLLNDTPGAVRYQETDANGTPLVSDADGAFVGAMYFRKALLGKLSADYASTGKPAKRVTVTVQFHDE